MNYRKYILLPTAILIGMSTVISCQQIEAVSEDAVTSAVYDGTLTDYLEAGGLEGNASFDSLLYLIDQIPGLKDSLNAPDKTYTLFAIPDQSFKTALQTLNSFRHDYKLGGDLSLKDLMIEPFVVNDTTIAFPDTEFADTTIVIRRYDYRAQMDSLVRCYLFNSEVTAAQLSADEGEAEIPSSLYGHSMYVQTGRDAASGALNLGTTYLKLIDTNGSKLPALWVTAEVKSADIRAKNGWLHLLSERHEFGFNKMVKYFQNYGNEYEKK